MNYNSKKRRIPSNPKCEICGEPATSTVRAHCGHDSFICKVCQVEYTDDLEYADCADCESKGDNKRDIDD